ncbi:MAG: hypothetical protein LBL98_08420 [Ruminococcus sp.]|jgi:hypothetical protein|nr:hypothetical protein [Ruminococcus sp.]
MIASEKEIIRRNVSGYVFKVKNKRQLDAALKLADFVIAPPEIYFEHEKVWLAPPRFGECNIPAREIYCQNVGHLMYNGNKHGGFGLNVINNEAAELLSSFGVNDITVGIEANIKDILRIKSDILTIYAYGRFPLMLTRQRLGGSLTDRTKRRFPVVENEILNSVKLSLSGKKVNADRLLLDFFDETPSEMEDILKSFRDNINMENITRGLYGI